MEVLEERKGLKGEPSSILRLWVMACLFNLSRALNLEKYGLKFD